MPDGITAVRSAAPELHPGESAEAQTETDEGTPQPPADTGSGEFASKDDREDERRQPAGGAHKESLAGIRSSRQRVWPTLIVFQPEPHAKAYLPRFCTTNSIDLTS